MLLNQFVNESLILVQIHGKDSPKSQQSSSGSSNLSVRSEEKEEEEKEEESNRVKKEAEDGEEKSCQMLLETIRSVRNSCDPCPWSVCICTIKNCSSMGNKDPSDRVTCAAIESNMSMVAAGYESNYLRIIPFHREERNAFRRSGLKRSGSHFSFNLKSSPLFACLEEEQAMKEARNGSESETGNGSKTGNGSESKTGNQKADRNMLRGHSQPITGLSFIPESNRLLSSSLDSTVRCWDLKNRLCDAVFSAGHLPNHSIWSLDSSPLGLYFATGSSDTLAKLWSPEYLHPLRLFVGHTSDVNVIRFHPNCKYLASGSADSTIKIWSVSDGKCVRSLSLSSSSLSSGSTKSCSVTTLSFSPNGHLLVSSAIDGIIRLWDLRMSKLFKSYRGHRDIVNHVSFNLDGSIVSSTSFDQTIKLWPVESSASSQSNPYHSSSDQQQASNETIRYV